MTNIILMPLFIFGIVTLVNIFSGGEAQKNVGTLVY